MDKSQAVGGGILNGEVPTADTDGFGIVAFAVILVIIIETSLGSADSIDEGGTLGGLDGSDECTSLVARLITWHFAGHIAGHMA